VPYTTPLDVNSFAERDRRIGTIRHEEGVKLPTALNSGFQIVRGDYLTWTSDDNVYRPEAIAEMLAELERDMDVYLVYSDYSDIAENGDIICGVRVHPPEKLAHLNSVNARFLYRRRVYDTIGDYDPALLLAEDYEYWVRAALVFRLQPLHKDLYLKRSHGGSLTARFGEMVREAHEQVLLRYLPQLSWAGRAERATGYRLLADWAIARHDFRGASGHILSAARLALASTLWWTLGRIRQAIT
jgi:glycosyltransferase involved in cell wall biosynthesis